MEFGIGCCCDECKGTLCKGRMPKRINLTIADPGGGSYLCRDLYYGVFECMVKVGYACYEFSSVLNRVGSGLGGGCALDSTARRFAIFFMTGHIAIEAYDDTKIGGIGIGLPIPGLAAKWVVYGSNVNCRSLITLTKISNDISGFPFPSTITIEQTPS